MMTAEKFWKFVDKTETCWLWTGAESKGYGLCHWKHKCIQASRVAYELLVRELLPHEELHHNKCKVTLCIRPDHMEVTTRKTHPDGGGPTNRMKTHCKRGHEFTPENTLVVTKPGGQKYRRCKKCASRWGADYWLRSKGKLI